MTERGAWRVPMANKGPWWVERSEPMVRGACKQRCIQCCRTSRMELSLIWRLGLTAVGKVGTEGAQVRRDEGPGIGLIPTRTLGQSQGLKVGTGTKGASRLSRPVTPVVETRAVVMVAKRMR